MDQKRIKAKLIIERSTQDAGTTNRAKGAIQKGNSKEKLRGILWKNKWGKWEGRKPTDRNMTPFLERQFHLSIGGETFQVAVIVPSGNAHLVGVISSYKGSGADGPYLSVGEGDNALGCAASEMGRGALMVPVVSGPAVPAAPIIGAVAGLVSRVLAVAPEAVDVGWECPLALPKGATGWGPWIFYHSSLKAVRAHVVYNVVVVGRSHVQYGRIPRRRQCGPSFRLSAYVCMGQ